MNEYIISEIFLDPIFAGFIVNYFSKTSVDDTVTQDELDAIKSLDLQNLGIEKINGINYLNNVGSLFLNKNKISDLSPLASLQTLEWLELNHNNIYDITPLGDIENLYWLELNYNYVSDLTVLSNLKEISTLYLNYNNVNDLTPLKNVTTLLSLRADHNKISSLGPLLNLTSMIELSVSHNNLVSVGALSKLTALEELYIDHNDISDLVGLEDLTLLEKLYANNNSIADITPLAALTALDTLSISDNKINNVETVSNLTNLVTLVLNHNYISDMSPIRSLTKLKKLFLNYNQISSISGFTPSTYTKFEVKNQTVYFGRKKVGEESDDINILDGSGARLDLDIRAGHGVYTVSTGKAVWYEANQNILKWPKLSTDSLSQYFTGLVMQKSEKEQIKNLFTDQNLAEHIASVLNKRKVAPIDLIELDVIRKLKADNLGITNLAGMDLLVNLTELTLNKNMISDLTPLIGLNITHLSLDNIKSGDNSVSLDDLKVGSLTTLESLSLDHNGITSINSLSNLKKLENLSLQDNQISDPSPLGQLSSLKTLNLNKNNLSTFGLALPKLMALRLDNNSMASGLGNLTPNNLPSIEQLYLNNNGIDDLGSFPILKTLKILELNDNSFTYVTPLAQLENLLSLEINNFAGSLEPLEGLKKLWFKPQQ